MKKKIALTILLCLVFFFLGYLFSNNKEINKNINARTDLEINNVKITIEDNSDINIINKYLEDIDNQPEYLINNCNNIIFTSDNLSERFNLKNISNKVLAITLDDSIYINTDKYEKYVITHELFHVFDYKNNWVTKTDDFLTIYNEEKDIIKVSPGNNENAQEFFASAGEEFIFNPDDLKCNAPKTYNYINNIVKNSEN